MKIEIKSIFGSVLFEYECKNNTIKKTLLEAIESNADLRNANLSNANLHNANLSNADLRNADLRNANLSNADLRNANLRNADLRNANLSNADLRNADLRNANLHNADLYNADLRNADLYNADLRNAKNKGLAFLPIYCKWSICIIGDNIRIGCKIKSIKEWDIFFNSNEVYETERNTEDFKRIEAMYNAYKSYLLTLKK